MAKYNPVEREKYWQEFWENEGVYRFDPDSKKEVFSIDTPPPTVSGKLHMGHVFSYTQAEVIARYRRMAGYNVYYPFGMDDNGLPTERLVEQELGIKGSETNRKEFVEKCLELVGAYHQKYRDLWQSLGFSVDWRLLYSTISKDIQKLTQSNFIELYEAGHIYRKKSPSLWCTQCQTSVAQAEVEDSKRPSVFYDLAFEDAEGNEVIVATTRPELLPACVAVMVNPEDDRYKHLIGKEMKTPLGETVKVFSDIKVQIEKGSGVVMCCTYGDETDLQWKEQFALKEKIIIDQNGRFNELAPEMMRGMNIKEGRAAIIDHLKLSNKVRKEAPIEHDVGVHERCGTPIEIINTDQWFVKVLEIKKELMKLGEEVNWHPKYMKQRYLSWVENLKWDWCISRDRFYGIPIPAFYCSKCKEVVIPKETDLPIDPLNDKLEATCLKCGGSDFEGDNLIFDTWFTSGNTPEINSTLNKDLTKGKIQIPMSLRPQAHDIIRTWSFYTIVLAFYKYKQIPWKEAAISGHILLRKGEKISKRTGGGNLRPEEQINLHSADAIRYAMCGASLGMDAYYEEKEIENGKKLINKLFNASNFCFMALKDYEIKNLTEEELEPIDQWTWYKSVEAAEQMKKYFENYDFSHARDTVSRFFFEVFCDNYLEIIKKRIYDLPSGDPKKVSAQTTLFHTLLSILKMWSPFVPHITEEIYQSFYAGKAESVDRSIHLTAWPKASKEKSEDKLEENNKIAEEVLRIISLVRGQKSKDGVNLGKEVERIEIAHPWIEKETILPYYFDLMGVTRAKEILITKSDSEIEIKMTYLNS